MPVKIPVGVQLYSLRTECAKDLGHVFKEVARMGYDGVEFAGYYGRTGKELKKMLDDVGLKCCGTHTRIETLSGDELEKTVAFNKDLGNDYLIVPVLEAELRKTAANWRHNAVLFNEISDKLAPHGMLTGYHNHHMEFEKLPDGETPWDVFFSALKPEVIMQLDTGNALMAGVDIAPFVSRYPGRAITVHLKEYSAARNKAVIGEGTVNWADIFKVCETVGGTKWYIVEQECEGMGQLECVEVCLRNLRKMGK